MSDPRFTFDNFVVGPANRLASAAARRAADAPGTNYNPLYLYSASGLGKSHILSAIAQRTERDHPERVVLYRSVESYLIELVRVLEEGTQEEMRDRYLRVDALLLDDVQFLTGQPQAQEMLLRTMDGLTQRGSQVVLASDRPPAEINGLDARLLSRFSGGLIVDIGSPDYETRVAIVRRKAEGRGVVLTAGVAEAVARVPFRNVRELQGALNRVLAVQDLEGRPVRADEVPALLGVEAPEPESSSPAPPESPSTPSPAARERARPFPPLPPGPELADLEGRVSPLAHRAAGRVVGAQPPDYNPLYLHAPDPERVRSLLEAVGRSFRANRPDARVGLVSLEEFSEDVIRALSEGVATAWRERWGSVDLFLLHGVEGLRSAERAEEELFHLFETLLRRGAVVVLGGDRPPAAIEGIDDRLRSRFEGGLVVEVSGGDALDGSRGDRVDPSERDPADASEGARAVEVSEGDRVDVGQVPEQDLVRAEVARRARAWFPSREKVVWDWPVLEERLRELPEGAGVDGDRG